MSDVRIPITLVMGWSRRAKSEAVQWLCAPDPSGVAVVTSEPTPAPEGARVVEGPEWVAERSLGCACCAVRLDVRTAISRLAARRRPPRRIVVVAAAQADAGPLLATLLSHLDVVRHTKIEAVVSVVDGREATVRFATGQALAPGADGEEHVALADGIVVVGAHQLTSHASHDLCQALHRLNPYSPVWMPEAQAWPVSAPASAAYSFAQVAARLDAIASPAASTHRCCLVDVEGTSDPRTLEDWSRGLFRDQGARLLRLQAVCSLRERAGRWACSGVRSFYATGSCGPRPAGISRARVLAVGRDLDVEALAGSLRIALAASA